MKDRTDELFDALGGGPAQGDVAPKNEPEVTPKGRVHRRLARAAALSPTTDGGTVTAFQTAHPGVVQWLTNYRGAFPFYLSLKEQYERRGDLTERQIESVYKAIERDGGTPIQAVSPIYTALKVVREAQAENINDPRAMLAMIDAAIKMHAPKVVAPKRAFTLAVGEVVRVSKFIARKIGHEAGLNRAHFLLEVVEVHDETAKAYKLKVRMSAQRSNRCCVCGLELTNPESVQNGIGPECGDGYKLDWKSDRPALEQLAEKLRVASVVDLWLPKSVIKERLGAK